MGRQYGGQGMYQIFNLILILILILQNEKIIGPA